MEELKKRTFNVMDRINQNWVEALQVAQETGTGIDVTTVFGKYSENVKELLDAFQEYQIRLYGKKGWFK